MPSGRAKSWASRSGRACWFRRSIGYLLPRSPSVAGREQVRELGANLDRVLAAIVRAIAVAMVLGVALSLVGTATKVELCVLCAALPYTLALSILQRRGYFTLCVHGV